MIWSQVPLPSANFYHSEPQTPIMCNGDKVIQAYLRDNVSLVSDKNNKANIAKMSHKFFDVCIKVIFILYYSPLNIL